ncbi:MAG: hypothetical protein ACLVJ6_14655 [Merdibacter sp.]
MTQGKHFEDWLYRSGHLLLCQTGLTITDDAAVVVTITGMDVPTEMYKVTLPLLLAIPSHYPRRCHHWCAVGTEVYVYVTPTALRRLWC